ncbi:MAG TPA: ABC transporter permease [Opitutaceae bacterium]|jgi:predicted permease|nr:ABC transporter permease [Opitutaceae bacterium]
MTSGWLRRLRDAFRRQSLADAFEEERAFHLEQLTALHRSRGLSPQEARAEAAREFGNEVQAREALREQAGFPAWDRLARDFRHAARALRNRPWISVFVVLVLGFGLGSAVAVYSLIDSVFLRALAVPGAGELWAAAPAYDAPVNRLSRGTVDRMEALLPPNSVAAYSSGGRCTVQAEGRDPSRVEAQLVNGRFFSTLRIEPAFGRALVPLDDVPGAANPVVVTSFRWAELTFGSAAAALGRRITVNGKPVTVVGVLPPAFRGIVLGQDTDLWFPAALLPQIHVDLSSSESIGDDRPNQADWNREERIAWMQLLVRVPRGAPPPQAALDRAGAAERAELVLTADDPTVREIIRHHHWHLIPAPGGLSRFRDGFHSAGWLLSGVVAAMLLLVCTNAAGLLLVRSMSRHRELGIRLAIGAAAHQVARLVLVEALLLSALGAVAGWLFASWLLPVLVRVLVPRGVGLRAALDGRSLAIMAGIAVLGAAASALIPVLWIARIQPLRALAGNRGIGGAPVRVGRILVVAQFVIAVALVTVAADMGRSLQEALAADPGFSRSGVVTAVFDPAAAGFSHEGVPALLDRLRAAVRSVPGVEAAGFASSGILTGSTSTSSVTFRAASVQTGQGEYQHDAVTPGYFAAVGAPLLLGREFQPADRAGAPPVAIVSASLARSIYGAANPIGQRFGYDIKPSAKDLTIIGVVADMRINGVREAAPEEFYYPLAQGTEEMPEFIAVRFTGAPAAVADGVRAALAKAQPGLLFSKWMTLQDRMSDDVSSDVATARLTYVFGGGAVLLAAIGVAAALGYLVILRQRELALRIAVGAQPRRLFGGVIADAVRLSGLGSLIGFALIWLASLLPFVRALLSLSAVLAPALMAALVVMAAALIAAWMPARRAARVDPFLLLKAE